MTDLLTWLQYPELLAWLGLIIFMVALLESLVIVGLALPGVAMLATAAWLAGQQQMPVLQLLACGCAGAVMGDTLGFYAGRYLAPAIYRTALLKRHPEWQLRGEAFFQRYGALSLLLGRFIGPIRPFIPFVAGSLHMAARRFWGINILSALLWAPVYLLPGYWLGQQSELLDGQSDHLLQLAATVLLVLLVGYGLHHQLQPQRRLHRHITSLPTPVGATVMGGLALALWAMLLAWRTLLPMQPSELWLHQWLSQWPETLYPLAVGITLLGDPAAAGLILLLVATVLISQGQRRSAAVFVLLLLCVAAGNYLLKISFAWQRPDTGAALYSSFSFPSGHASNGATLFAMLAVLLAVRLNEAMRRRVYAVMALPTLLIPLSRVWLDLHWPLDVLAGLCEGLMAAALWRHWLACSAVSLGPQVRLLLMAGSLLLLAGYVIWQLPTALLFYQRTGAV